MERQDRIDLFGATALTLFALFLAFNQIVIKLVNAGIQPVFFAGLRSGIAILALALWLWWRGLPVRPDRRYLGLGVASGLLFAAEFVFLFIALDLTTVTRTAIMLYSMPIWLAIGAHLVLPGERLTPRRIAGLGLAFAGVVMAFADHPPPGSGAPAPNIVGDVLAVLAAIAWAGIALIARGTRFREVRPEAQLFWQVLVSAPVLVALAPLFGPLIRDFQTWHIAGLLFQGILVSAAGFVFWLWLLSVYPAGGVASFSFLTPVFGVALGWLLLGEHVGLPLIGALVLVAAGLWLINRPAKGAQVPQKVRVTTSSSKGAA